MVCFPIKSGSALVILNGISILTPPLSEKCKSIITNKSISLCIMNVNNSSKFYTYKLVKRMYLIYEEVRLYNIYSNIFSVV